jgi:hypothetical protein
MAWTIFGANDVRFCERPAGAKTRRPRLLTSVNALLQFIGGQVVAGSTPVSPTERNSNSRPVSEIRSCLISFLVAIRRVEHLGQHPEHVNGVPTSGTPANASTRLCRAAANSRRCGSGRVSVVRFAKAGTALPHRLSFVSAYETGSIAVVCR